jgi:hypothetical protein
VKNHWKFAPAYCSGDQVMLGGASGRIVDIFPDGIHMVRLDTSGKIVATTAPALAPGKCCEKPSAGGHGSVINHHKAP